MKKNLHKIGLITCALSCLGSQLMGSALQQQYTVASVVHIQKSKSGPDQKVVQRSLKDALTELAIAYGANLMYVEELVSNKFVNNELLKKKSTRIETLLSKLLAHQGLSFKKVSEKQFVIYKEGDLVNLNVADTESNQNDGQMDLTNSQLSNNQHVDNERSIGGTVISTEDQNPLPGVSVRVKGSSKGTVTDVNGNFSLMVKEGDVLVFAMIGFKSKEITIGKTINYKVELSQDAKALSEVVVTALNIKRSEKSLGYATQKVDGKDLQTVKGVDLATSLTGRVSGLVVKNSTEFNSAPVLQLRGETPRLIVDGVDFDNLSLRDIPTDDIESIDILKGPAAAALYGNRGKNGVYLITTKKGAKSKGFSVDVNSNTMMQLGFLAIPEVQTNYARGINGQIDNDYVWGPRLNVGNTTTQWNPISKQMEDNMPLNSVGNNNLRNFMNTGVIANNNFSIAQTGEIGSFKVGINHVHNTGQFPNQKLNMLNLTTAGEIKVNNKFTIENRLGISRRTSPQNWGSGYTNQGYLYQLLVWTGSEYDIRDYKDYWVTPYKTQNWLYNNWYDNPYLIAYEKLDASEVNNMYASLTANYKFTPDLNLMLRLGYDNYNNKSTMSNAAANIFSVRGGWNAKGMYSISESRGFSTTNDLILTYNKTLGKFSIESMAGGNFFHKNDESMSGATKNGLISPTFLSLRGSVEPVTLSQSALPQERASIYGRTAFGWNNAVYLDFTGRNEWNSTQPASTRSFFYPAVNTSVVVSELVKLPRFIEMFKLRAAYSDFKVPASIFATNRTYNTTTGAWNTLNSASYPAGLLGNKDLRPSSERTWEFGSAGYLFKKRLHFDVTYFNKLYYDTQVSATLPSSTGFTGTLLNSGQTISRRGVEVSLDGSIIKKQNFEWTSTLNWATQHRYYVDLDPVYSADNLWTKSGRRVDAYTSTYWLTDPEGNVIHVNGLPQRSSYSKQLGFSDPDFAFGLINNFIYKNWSLGINLDGRIGGLMYNDLADVMWDTGVHPDTDNQYRYDQVVNGLNNYIGKGVKIVSGTVTYDKYGNITSDTRQYAPNDVQVGYQNYARRFRGGDMGIQDESFFKLREVSLGYSFPSKLLNKVGLKRAALSVTGQNMFLWTNFKYSDPDRDEEDLNSPSQRMIGFNLKIGI